MIKVFKKMARPEEKHQIEMCQRTNRDAKQRSQGRDNTFFFTTHMDPKRVDGYLVQTNVLLCVD